MKAGVIGAGKVGCTMGKFLSLGGVRITGYMSRTPESAIAAAKFTDSRYYESSADLAADSDAIFITVPDRAIRSVYEALPREEIRDKFICHCSGALSVEDAFPGISDCGAHGISIHPLFPVSTKYETYRELTGAFFCLEGDPEAVKTFAPIFNALGARTVQIPSAGKTRYHAACVMASNFMCALVEESITELATCGFSKESALAAITPLLRANLEHLTKVGPVSALTGPVERNDAETVRKHLRVLEGDTKARYVLLSRKLLEMAEQKHPCRDYTATERLLDAGEQPAEQEEK